MNNKVKKGDEFVWTEVEWLGVGKVIKVRDTKKGQSFDLKFSDGEERGWFYTEEIGTLIRRVTKLDKVLK